MNTSIDINLLVKIAQSAGEAIMQIYQHDFAVHFKDDRSPLTAADLASHHLIIDELSKHYPQIPIISEELATQVDFEVRKHWDYFFLVDPLDGTKEFIKKNGEFTVNIALIKGQESVLGVIHAPHFGKTYFAEKGKGAFKLEKSNLISLEPKNSPETLKVIISRSHLNKETTEYLENLRNQYKNIETLSMGSALKFGLLAEGNADIYIRHSPCMEWDTAAGHIIVNEVRKDLYNNSGEVLKYNKESLLNPSFIVK